MDRSLGALTALAVALALAPGLLAPAAADEPGPPLAGTAVSGSPARDAADAPELATGRYLDRLPAHGVRTYRLPRTAPGSTFHVAAMYVGAGDSVGTGLRIEVGTTPGDRGCGSGGVFRPTLGERAPVLLAATSTWTDVGDHPCATADELFLTVGAPADPADAGRAVEVRVFEEPAVSEHNLGLLPAPAAPEWEPLEPGRARPVAAGTTPTNAPVVTDGSHRLVLRPGRTAVLAVPLGWDQSLQAQLDARLPAGAPDPGGISVEVVTPLLGTSAVPLAEGSADRPADWRTPGVRGGRLRTGAQSQVVAYAHRDSYDSTLTSASLAGVHHVLVRWAAGDAAGAQLRGVRVAATLTLRTTGEPGDGVPAYTPSTLPAPEAGSRLVDGTLPEPAPQGPDARPPAAADDDSVVPLGGRGLAVAALATGLAVVGLLWLRRRRG